MPITTNNHHASHRVQVHLTRGNGPHYAALRCVECDRHIQWLSYTEAVQIQQLNETENS
jgi:hypothetical protein